MPRQSIGLQPRVGALEAPRRGGDPKMLNHDTQVPEIFRLIMQKAQRERSPEEDDAARRFVLGRATVAEYLAARRKEASRLSPRRWPRFNPGPVARVIRWGQRKGRREFPLAYRREHDAWRDFDRALESCERALKNLRYAGTLQSPPPDFFHPVLFKRVSGFATRSNRPCPNTIAAERQCASATSRH